MRDHEKGGALTEVTFFILLSLYTPRHGYGILQFVEEETRGRVILGAGTLYGALEALVKKGWISLFQMEKNKKLYVITETGKEAANNELARLHTVFETGKSIISREDLTDGET